MPWPEFLPSFICSMRRTAGQLEALFPRPYFFRARGLFLSHSLHSHALRFHRLSYTLVVMKYQHKFDARQTADYEAWIEVEGKRVNEYEVKPYVFDDPFEGPLPGTECWIEGIDDRVCSQLPCLLCLVHVLFSFRSSLGPFVSASNFPKAQ